MNKNAFGLQKGEFAFPSHRRDERIYGKILRSYVLDDVHFCSINIFFSRKVPYFYEKSFFDKINSIENFCIKGMCLAKNDLIYLVAELKKLNADLDDMYFTMNLIDVLDQNRQLQIYLTHKYPGFARNRGQKIIIIKYKNHIFSEFKFSFFFNQSCLDIFVDSIEYAIS